MSEFRIEAGDIVNVIFPTCPAERLTILSKPWETGDSWTGAREDGTLVNFMVFEKMVRIRSAR